MALCFCLLFPVYKSQDHTSLPQGYPWTPSWRGAFIFLVGCPVRITAFHVSTYFFVIVFFYFYFPPSQLFAYPGFLVPRNTTLVAGSVYRLDHQVSCGTFPLHSVCFVTLFPIRNKLCVACGWAGFSSGTLIAMFWELYKVNAGAEVSENVPYFAV